MVPPEIDVGVPDTEVSTDFPVADGGTYPCRIAQVIAGQKSQAGKDKLVFVYAPTAQLSGQIKGDNGTMVPTTIPAGREIFRQSVSLQANALFTLKGIQKACGGAGWKGSKVRTEEFVGKIVNLVVTKAQDAKGKWFNQVDDVLPA